MPGSLLIINDVDDWYACVANTGIKYAFSDGVSSIIEFCNAMRIRDFGQFPAIFDGDPDPQIIVGQLFEDCDEALVIDDVVWSGIDSGTLIIQDLEVVSGDILEAFL